MTVVAKQKFASQRSVYGESFDDVWLVTGAADHDEAAEAVLTIAPVVVDTLFRKNPSVDDMEDGSHLVSVPYRRGGNVKPPPKEVGDSSFSFDTSGGTQHITQSKATWSYGTQGPGSAGPDFQGAIGYNGKDVEGVDITVPVFKWSETHCLAAEAVTLQYAKTLRDLTGKVNDEPFRGFADGEVLFLGASGTRRGDNAWEITFNFASSENATNIEIGDITVAAKGGWQYLWVLYESQEDEGAKAIVKRPVAAYVEKVYDDGDYDGLNIPEPLDE